MQIHELTLRRRQQVSEGLWDSLNAALDVASGSRPELANLSFNDARKAAQRSGQIEKASKQAQKAWDQYVPQLEKAIARRAPAQPTTATSADNEPVFVGGQRLDPKNPEDAKMIQRVRQQQGQKQPPSQPTGKNPLENFRNRSDGLYEKYLKAFVQKNLFSGMPYSRLINAQDVDQIISDMSRPENAGSDRQEKLWQQLGLEAATAQLLPQSAGGVGATPSASARTRQPAEPQTSDELVEPVKQAEKSDANLTADQLKLAGDVVRKNFTGNEDKIDSTGDEAVDALLKAMGFDI